MPNFATTLKNEIARLARRAVRGELKLLRKASAQFRRDIARLKRLHAQVNSEVGRLGRRAPPAAVPKAGDAQADGLRYRAGGVASHRKRLGLSARDFGKLVGVTGHTVYQWESGASRPRRSQLAALAAIRGIGRREAAARLGGAAKAPAKKGRKAARRAKRK